MGKEGKQEQLLEYLLSFVTENKRQLIESRLLERTRHLTIVLEDIYHSQNANAVVRTADCFGIQDVHVIEEDNPYDLNPRVVKGALKWINLLRYQHHEDNMAVCINRLRSKGYSIVATTPRAGSISLHELPLERPIALLFGNEHRGLSPLALELADQSMYIPMYGFTESFNISVSAAICLHHLTMRLRQSDVPWQLSEAEMYELKMEWVRTVLKDPDGMERRFWAEQG